MQKQDLLSQLAANVVSLSAHVIAIGIFFSHRMRCVRAGPPCGRVNYLADCPVGWALDLTLQKCKPPHEYQVRQTVHAFPTVMLADTSQGHCSAQSFKFTSLDGKKEAETSCKVTHVFCLGSITLLTRCAGMLSVLGHGYVRALMSAKLETSLPSRQLHYILAT